MAKKTLIFIFYFIITALFLHAEDQSGMASWYGPAFHGKKTANGEIFNTNDFTAAHRTLPFNSIVQVTSLENNKTTIVRINDRGPFAKERILDLSQAAAEEIDMIKNGTMKIKITVLEVGENKYHRYSNHFYKIQLASFGDEANAKKHADSVKKIIENVIVEKVIKDKTLYRVCIDDLNYSEAQLLRVKLRKSGIYDYLLIKKKKTKKES